MSGRWPIMGWQIDTPAHEAVMEALGAASVCWDENGVFLAERAEAIGEELLDLLQAKQWSVA